MYHSQRPLAEAHPHPPASYSTTAPIIEILSAYWKSDRWPLLLVMIVVLLSSATMVGAPYLFSRLINRLPQAGAHTLTYGFILYAILLGINMVLQHMVQYLSFMRSENLAFIVTTRNFERILRKKADFFIEYNPAEIQAAGEKGRTGLKALVQLGLVALIPGAMQIALALVTLGAMIDFQVALVVMIYGIVVVAFSSAAARRARVYLDAAVGASQANVRFVGNAMSSMETLRQFGSRAWMSQRFEQKAQEVRANWRAYVLRRVSYMAFVGLGLAVQFTITFLILLPRYESNALTVGDLVLFNMLLLQLNTPFDMIARSIDDVARSSALLAPLLTLWAAPEERPATNAKSFAPTHGEITFEDVDFSYGNGRGVSSVSFQASRGGITFLSGRTGSGKSTVFKLALRSIEPQAGRILVDGTDLADIDRPDWYAHVAVVPQDVVLLNETLADNILLGRARDERRLREAAQRSAILPLIEGLPQGFETMVGERGLKLSGGERQRIAITRALYGNPAIIFLDEASSALDEATERDVMAHIRSLATDVTVLAITHRKSVIAKGDRVIDLDAGWHRPDRR